MTYLLLVIGFFLLIKGADFFVEGSSSVAKKLHIPPIVIGMTIVAIGTSLPEFAVSVTASIKGNNELAVSNVIGSNIFNLMIVCGICALFVPLAVNTSTLKREFPFSILIGVLLLGLGYFDMSIGRLDGIIFIIIFIIFLYVMVRTALKAKAENSDKDSSDEEKPLSTIKCILYILLGGAAIAFGGDTVVNSASTIAANFGLSQNLIGLTIVAMGTSLPELVTSIVAARKNQVDMAIGNVIGSNIFNILLVLGLSASISPIAFNMENVIDIIILTVMSIIAWIFAKTNGNIKRIEGIIMLLMYAGFTYYICIR